MVIALKLLAVFMTKVIAMAMEKLLFFMVTKLLVVAHVAEMRLLVVSTLKRRKRFYSGL